MHNMTSDSLNAYVKSISEIPKKSKDEQRELAIIINNSVCPKERQKAIDDLVECNLFLVIKSAIALSQKVGSHIDVMDLVSTGNIGLLVAAEKYDPYNKAGANFCSYAFAAIRSHMVRELQKTNTVKIPSNLYEQYRKMKKISESTDEELSDDELCDKMSITKNALDNTRKVFSTKMVHLDSLVSEDGSSYEFDFDNVGSNNEALNGLLRDEVISRLKMHVDRLAKPQKDVLNELYFSGMDYKLCDIADKLRKSKAAVSICKVRGLRKLKKMISNDELVELSSIFANM